VEVEAVEAVEVEAAEAVEVEAEAADSCRCLLTVTRNYEGGKI
jgi:hypothetical protein